MNSILQSGVTNAILATALAIVVACAARLCRRPALVHSLWLLVLLKLVTPAFISVHVPHSAWSPSADSSPQDPVASPAKVAEAPAVPNREDVSQQAPERVNEAAGPELSGAVGMISSEPEQIAPGESADNALPSKTDVPEQTTSGIHWSAWLLTVWLAGSAATLVLAVVRVLRFQRLLGHARPVPVELQDHVEQLGWKLGLDRCPKVAFLPGRLSPMFWSLTGRHLLLLPVGLWDRLTPEQRDSLLLHELAHVRRRDHWVRLFELCVTALYWWHPVAWWARSELRRAEEDCCDAWVVWATPGKARAYAAALVETVDFLSEAPAVLPVGASGVGPAQDLRRRVTMIMQGRTPRSLTWTGIAGVLGLAAMLLPLTPSFAQRPVEGDNRLLREERNPTTDKKQDDTRANDQLQQEIEKAKAELDKAAADLQKAQAVVRERQAQLEKLVAELRGRPDNNLRNPDPDPRRRGDGGARFDGITGNIIIVGPDGKKLEFKLAPDGKLPPELLKALNDMAEMQKFELRLDPKTIRPDALPSDVDREKLLHILREREKREKDTLDGPRRDSQDRIGELEKRMEHMMRELEQLRSELKKSDQPRKSDLPRDPASPGR